METNQIIPKSFKNYPNYPTPSIQKSPFSHPSNGLQLVPIPGFFETPGFDQPPDQLKGRRCDDARARHTGVGGFQYAGLHQPWVIVMVASPTNNTSGRKNSECLDGVQWVFMCAKHQMVHPLIFTILIFRLRVMPSNMFQYLWQVKSKS